MASFLSIKLEPSYAQFGDGCKVFGHNLVYRGVVAGTLSDDEYRRHLELTDIYNRVSYQQPLQFVDICQ